MLKHILGVAALVVLFVTPAAAQDRDMGLLKVCKVLPAPIPANLTFPFTTSVNNGPVSPPFAVPAGPPPDGLCWIAGLMPIGASVVVAENVPAGYAVANRTASTAFTLVSTNAVRVTINPGVTVVPFTDRKAEMGYIEICKFTTTAGSYTFNVNSGAATVTLPAVGCSPPIQVTSGPVVVTETGAQTGTVWSQCATWHNGQSTPCTVTAQSTTVTVTPGQIAGETLVLAVNGPKPGTASTGRRATDDEERTLRGFGLTPQ